VKGLGGWLRGLSELSKLDDRVFNDCGSGGIVDIGIYLPVGRAALDRLDDGCVLAFWLWVRGCKVVDLQ
jgi:hypothetical protein